MSGNGILTDFPPRMLSAHAANRFYVEIGVMSLSPIIAVFTEVSGLQVEMEVFPYEEGGNNSFVHKLPGRLKIGNVTLKHGMTRSNDFLRWCLTPITRGDRPVERKNVTVCMFDQIGIPVIRWNFDGAYPVKWTGPQFVADSTTIAIESVELAHNGVSVDTL